MNVIDSTARVVSEKSTFRSRARDAWRNTKRRYSDFREREPHIAKSAEMGGAMMVGMYAVIVVAELAITTVKVIKS